MGDWLRDLADWVDGVEYRVERTWQRWFPPPPAPVFLGPQPTVDFMWRRIQVDMAAEFEFTTEFEWAKFPKAPDDASR